MLAVAFPALTSTIALWTGALAFINLVVLWLTWRATRRQAKASELQATAARALIQVAEEQTKAARDAALSAQHQAESSELQAKAARALIDVATEQTTATKDAAVSAQRQCELLSSQMEQATAPLIVAEPDDRLNMSNFKVINQGKGVAFQVFYWQGGLEVKDSQGFRIYPVQPSTMAPGVSAYLPIPPAWEVFTVRYKGIDREERWTVVYRDSRKSQQHIVRHRGQELYLS